MEVTFEIEGLSVLDQKLKQMETAIAKRIARRALIAGAKIVQRKTMSSALQIVGGMMSYEIWNSIIIKTLRMGRTSVYRVGVMIDPKANDTFVYLTKRKNPGKRYYIPAAIEFGHKTPKSRRKVAEIPFMRKAAEATMSLAAAAIAATLKTEIEKQTQKSGS